MPFNLPKQKTSIEEKQWISLSQYTRQEPSQQKENIGACVTNLMEKYNYKIGQINYAPEEESFKTLLVCYNITPILGKKTTTMHRFTKISFDSSDKLKGMYKYSTYVYLFAFIASVKWPPNVMLEILGIDTQTFTNLSIGNDLIYKYFKKIGILVR